jgi:hypothetical protein
LLVVIAIASVPLLIAAAIIYLIALVVGVIGLLLITWGVAIARGTYIVVVLLQQPALANVLRAASASGRPRQSRRLELVRTAPLAVVARGRPLPRVWWFQELQSAGANRPAVSVASRAQILPAVQDASCR